MSNFICSECGTNYIDCGCDGYKTPREIELENKLDIATKALELYQNEEAPLNCPKENEKGSYYPFRYNYVVAKEALKQIKELDK